jgi:parvulin-like peptidyl-prolyl isomerase
MALVVNGELIDDAAIREEENSIRPRLEEAMASEPPAVLEQRVRDWARENLIERAVLRQTALADPEPIASDKIDALVNEIRTTSPSQSGCIAPVDDATLRRELEIRLRIERIVERLTSKVSPPKPKDISDHYVKHRDQYTAPESVHAAHIVKNVDENTDEAAARAAIGEAERRLNEGADFAALADELSDCPGRGGDLGFFPRGQMVDEFERIVFELQPGQRSGVFRTPFGFHIARMIERRPAGMLGLQEVKDRIAEELLRLKREKAVEQYLDKLIARAEVQEAAAVAEKA